MKTPPTQPCRHSRLPADKIPWPSARIIRLGLALAAAGCAISAAAGEEPATAAPTVAFAVVTREDLFNPLTIQAEFRPYQEIDLHAKVSGYLKQINVDIGDQVKAGDPIGLLEVPELQEDIERAVASEQRAEAESKEASLAHARLKSVGQSQPTMVAPQDLDAAEAKDSAALAALAAAKADTEKYRTLEAYTRITAPFGGVITKRYADPGALIQAGTASATQAEPLVRLSENERLRLDFPVPAADAGAMKVGDPVEILLDANPVAIDGTISRFTRRIAMETRTMETEVEVPNPDLKLIPGMYATVVLKMQLRPNTLAIPIEAVAGGAHPTVYVVNANQEIEERPVQLGLETPTRFEILSGLKEGERVMIGSRSQVRIGQKVSPQPIGGNPTNP